MTGNFYKVGCNRYSSAISGAPLPFQPRPAVERAGSLKGVAEGEIYEAPLFLAEAGIEASNDGL